MKCVYSAARVDGCQFLDNSAGYGGGMMFCWTPSPQVERCSLQGNLGVYGGAAYW